MFNFVLIIKNSVMNIFKKSVAITLEPTYGKHNGKELHLVNSKYSNHNLLYFGCNKINQVNNVLL